MNLPHIFTGDLVRTWNGLKLHGNWFLENFTISSKFISNYTFLIQPFSNQDPSSGFNEFFEEGKLEWMKITICFAVSTLTNKLKLQNEYSLQFYIALVRVPIPYILCSTPVNDRWQVWGSKK